MIERDAAVARCLEEAAAAGAAVFVGNGNNARVAAALCDDRRVFYMLGSMGLCASIAAGYCHSSGRSTLVIEGDGNTLMSLNALPAVARCASDRFAHVILDNGLYETTGSQRTLADAVDFPQLARGSSYRNGQTVNDLDELATAVRGALAGEGPGLLHAATVPAAGPQHPRVPLTPPQARSRFEEWHVEQ